MKKRLPLIVIQNNIIMLRNEESTEITDRLIYTTNVEFNINIV